MRAEDMSQTAPRVLLGLAAVAIMFAAADTYVVVLALPDMMTTVGLDLDQLQRAAPIVSGFLLGYVGVLPLIGRISDLRGRVPVLLGCLIVFAIGSIVTAAAYDLPSVVTGRLIQGIGGGGLIPPTLALVADLWPAERRGLPLGIVGAVQELGSVVGPLYGAIVLSFGSWRDIFWLNCAVALVLAAAMVRMRDPDDRAPTRPGRLDLIGLGLGIMVLAGLALVMLEPDALVTGVTTGLAFLPVVGESRWLTPVALSTFGLAALFAVRETTARRPLLAWREWVGLGRETDLRGALMLTVGLGAIIAAFASAEPESATISPSAPWLLPIAVLAFAGFWWRQHTAPRPLIPRGALHARPAWGALVVSFFIGASLIAALVDIPFFARLTVYRNSQLEAALVLLRFLIALPVGAVLGGWLLRRVPAHVLTAIAMLLSAIAFAHMATWDADSLKHQGETLSLALGGLGFGLAIAPVNAALLEHTEGSVHGVASALLIVARMVGMLLGISALTTIGLHAFYDASAQIPPAAELCDGAATACRAYRDAVREAGIAQLHAVFVGAAVCATAAASLAVVLLRPTAGLVTSDTNDHAG